MDTDLLKKLIKLANNNPNENEANLAARKVCKMIEADNYNLVGGDQVRRTPPIRPRQSGTWNDIFRSYEPFWTSDWYNPPPPPKSKPKQEEPKRNPFPDGFYEKEPIKKEDTFHPNTREVTVNCRKCGTKFKMPYDEYFANKSARNCKGCEI